MSAPFLYGFESAEDIRREFEAAPDALDGARILFAEYVQESYEGLALVLFERDGKLFEVHGSHCSCNGLEDQWAPEETTLDALRARGLHAESTEGIAALKVILAVTAPAPLVP